MLKRGESVFSSLPLCFELESKASLGYEVKISKYNESASNRSALLNRGSMSSLCIGNELDLPKPKLVFDVKDNNKAYVLNTWSFFVAGLHVFGDSLIIKSYVDLTVQTCVRVSYVLY